VRDLLLLQLVDRQSRGADSSLRFGMTHIRKCCGTKRMLTRSPDHGDHPICGIIVPQPYRLH